MIDVERKTSLVDRAKSGRLGPAASGYHSGYTDGVAECLDQLEGISKASPGGCYRGPLPDELKNWIEGVRRRVKENT